MKIPKSSLLRFLIPVPFFLRFYWFLKWKSAVSFYSFNIKLVTSLTVVNWLLSREAEQKRITKNKHIPNGIYSVLIERANRWQSDTERLVRPHVFIETIQIYNQVRTHFFKFWLLFLNILRVK